MFSTDNNLSKEEKLDLINHLLDKLRNSINFNTIYLIFW